MTNSETAMIWKGIAHAANHRVSASRKNAADIARILYDHGARTTATLNAVETAIAADAPAATTDRARHSPKGDDGTK